MAVHSHLRPGADPRSRTSPASDVRGCRARPAGRRRCAIMLSGMVALVLATGGCTAVGRPGWRCRSSCPCHRGGAPEHRGGGSHSVQLVVEASGDLLIHPAIFELGAGLGGRPPIPFRSLVRADQALYSGRRPGAVPCRDADDASPLLVTPTFNTPPELATAIAQVPGWWPCSTAGTHALDQGQTVVRLHDPGAGSGRGGAHRHLLLGGRAGNAADHHGQGGPRRLPGLHRADQIAIPFADSLVGQPGQSGADPVRRLLRPPGRREGRHRQPALGR